MQAVGIDGLKVKFFQDAGFPDVEAYRPPLRERQKQNQRRLHLTLGYSFAMLALTTALTLTGFVAAFWHVAWRIGAVLSASVIVCGILVIAVIAHSLPRESGAESDLKSRYREYQLRRRKRGSQD